MTEGSPRGRASSLNPADCLAPRWQSLWTLRAGRLRPRLGLFSLGRIAVSSMRADPSSWVSPRLRRVGVRTGTSPIGHCPASSPGGNSPLSRV